MQRVLIVCLCFAASAGAQTMYKCQVGGKIEYSDRLCYSGAEVKRIAPDGGPTPEDRGRAHMRLEAEQARLEAQEQQRQDYRRAQQTTQRAQSLVNEKALAEKATLAKEDEKVLVHDPWTGWDYKTRAQIIAEDRRKEAQGLEAIEKNRWNAANCSGSMNFPGCSK